MTGTGAADDPFVVDQLPFVHAADTSVAGERAIDTYPGCQAGQNESGPELNDAQYQYDERRQSGAGQIHQEKAKA